MNPTELQLYLNLRAGLDLKRRDPLKFFRWCSKAQSMMATYLAMGLEVFARFGNSAGKTFGAAHLVVAIVRGLEWLDGVRLPKVREPVVWWVLTKTRRAQVDAAQAAYLEAIGAHPHEIAWDNRSKHYIDSIWVSTRWCVHGHGSHCGTCSRIVFHCEQSGVETMLGGRVDGIHSDEPPKESIWREARSRKRAGAQLLLLITATPLYRKDWFWMAVDFVDCLLRPNRGRVEIVSNMDENKFLTPWDRETLDNLWKGDPVYDARRWGKYVDATGWCPFKYPDIEAHEKGCREPWKVAKMKIETERDTARGIVIAHQSVNVELYYPREPDESYWGLGDPSTGISDAKHDPAGIHVYSRRRPRLVARYEGYLAAWGMGVLLGKLGRYYNNATLDVETNGGYGRGSLRALKDRARYTNINFRDLEEEPGKFRTVLGWHTSLAMRGQFIAGIQQWLEERSEPLVRSAAVLSCLRNITVDQTGKYLAAEGRHDEDMILLGRALVLFQTRPDFPVTPEEKRPTMRKALERELGRPSIFDESPEDGQPASRRVRTRRG